MNEDETLSDALVRKGFAQETKWKYNCTLLISIIIKYNSKCMLPKEDRLILTFCREGI